jgi:hypothetical protein
MDQEIISLLKAALECSVYVSPRDPGLTYEELATIGTTAGYLEGEVNDALRHVGSRFYGVPRIAPAEQDIGQWAFYFPENPEYKDYAALDFVFDELNLRLRSEGEARAQIERNVLVERAVAKGIERHNIEVAITWLVMAKQLVEKDSILRFAHRGAFARQLPSATRAMHQHVDAKPHKARAYPLVKDVMARRGDGRPRHPEPLDAFAEELALKGLPCVVARPSRECPLALPRAEQARRHPRASVNEAGAGGVGPRKKLGLARLLVPGARKDQGKGKRNFHLFVEMSRLTLGVKTLSR